MKNDIKCYFNKLLNNDVSIEEYSDDAFMYRLFYEIHGTVPYVMYFFDGIDEDDNEELVNGEFDWKETSKLIKKIPGCKTYRWKGNTIYYTDDWICHKGTIFNISPDIPEELSNCIQITKKDTANLIFVSVSNKGQFIKRLLPVNELDIDYDINYNEDFPHEKIEEILTGDKSSLLLMFGIPGTGKTSFLRKMIKDHPEQKFYWLDSSMFSMINSTEFMEFLLDSKGGVFILEDCESIVKDRNTNYNNLITPILNISDGMLGDSLKLKFFCTFNTSLKNIDQALLRKGRLSLKYEFGKLKKDRVQKLLDKLGINATATQDMALCDVYNYLEDNGQKETKKIGF